MFTMWDFTVLALLGGAHAAFIIVVILKFMVLSQADILAAIAAGCPV